MPRRVSLSALVLILLIVAATPARAGMPMPMLPGSGPRIYAQHLLERALGTHPGVLLLGMHVTPPGKGRNEIIASNFGCIGKPADRDDLHVIVSGQAKLEINKQGNRFEVELPLEDMIGTTVGALSVVFPYRPGEDRAALGRQAFAIRDALRRHILTLKNLFDPYPFVADPPPDDTLAQKLVDETLDAHPHLLVIGIHVTPPGATRNVIVASNFGRIGKPADGDDMSVVTSGKPKLELNADGKRYEVELWLLDRAGKSVGAVSFVFPYRKGENPQVLLRRAEHLRDALRARIPSRAALLARS